MRNYSLDLSQIVLALFLEDLVAFLTKRPFSDVVHTVRAVIVIRLRKRRTLRYRLSVARRPDNNPRCCAARSDDRRDREFLVKSWDCWTDRQTTSAA